MHGEVVGYALLSVMIQFRGQKHSVEVAVNPHLRHPLILGTNWPGFQSLLAYLCTSAPERKQRRRRRATVHAGEAVPEPSVAVSEEPSVSEKAIFLDRDDFPLEQSRDDTLKNAFEQVRVIDGQQECQLVNPLAHARGSARGHRFALVLVDYATRYPEAVPLRNISAKSVASALFQLISRVGIPKEILTDQGTAVMSRTIRKLYKLLGIKSIRTSVYHPQTDGLVERFNRTLKTMIRKFVREDAKNWDKWLEPLLFAVREVPQAFTGFSPFELLYGHQPRRVLDVLREAWEDGPSNSKN
ncbi:protein NYNRIN-like [Pimephales promelas]|nr:protein NYNRIN-like [Pimephales promelas]